MTLSRIKSSSFPLLCLLRCRWNPRYGSNYREAYWNLPDLFGAMIESGGTRSRCATFFSGFALVSVSLEMLWLKPHFLVWSKVSPSCRQWTSRFGSRSNLPKIYQYSPWDVSNSLRFHSLRSLETCEQTNDLPFSSGRSSGLFWAPGPWLLPLPWFMGSDSRRMIFMLVTPPVCSYGGLSSGYLPIVTWVCCQCQPESWSGYGLVPCWIYMFVHGHGHKFCCLRLVSLSLPCPVSAGVCSQDYALLRRDDQSQGRYWGYWWRRQRQRISKPQEAKPIITCDTVDVYENGFFHTSIVEGQGNNKRALQFRNVLLAWDWLVKKRTKVRLMNSFDFPCPKIYQSPYKSNVQMCIWPYAISFEFMRVWSKCRTNQRYWWSTLVRNAPYQIMLTCW